MTSSWISLRKHLLLSFVLCASIAHAGSIAGTAHDFRTQGWSGGQLCLPCHTPHVANSAVQQDAPLWNHELSTATYTPYSSATMSATIGQPDGVSKLCLGCHDGTVALDSFSGLSGSTKIASPIGTDLTPQHPISFAYDSALAQADQKLNDPTTTTTPLGGTITKDLLIQGKMQCTSCHDVHNKFGQQYLLRITDANSELCNVCHK